MVWFPPEPVLVRANVPDPVGDSPDFYYVAKDPFGQHPRGVDFIICGQYVVPGIHFFHVFQDAALCPFGRR